MGKHWCAGEHFAVEADERVVVLRGDLPGAVPRVVEEVGGTIEVLHDVGCARAQFDALLPRCAPGDLVEQSTTGEIAHERAVAAAQGVAPPPGSAMLLSLAAPPPRLARA